MDRKAIYNLQDRVSFLVLEAQSFCKIFGHKIVF